MRAKSSKQRCPALCILGHSVQLVIRTASGRKIMSNSINNSFGAIHCFLLS